MGRMEGVEPLHQDMWGRAASEVPSRGPPSAKFREALRSGVELRHCTVQHRAMLGEHDLLRVVRVVSLVRLQQAVRWWRSLPGPRTHDRPPKRRAIRVSRRINAYRHERSGETSKRAGHVETTLSDVISRFCRRCVNNGFCPSEEGECARRHDLAPRYDMKEDSRWCLDIGFTPSRSNVLAYHFGSLCYCSRTYDPSKTFVHLEDL